MIEFIDTIQCPLCGSTHSSKEGHTCSKVNQNATWASTGKGFWGEEPVMGIGETLRCILAELRQIRQMLERGAR